MGATEGGVEAIPVAQRSPGKIVVLKSEEARVHLADADQSALRLDAKEQVERLRKMVELASGQLLRAHRFSVYESRTVRTGTADPAAHGMRRVTQLNRKQGCSQQDTARQNWVGLGRIALAGCSIRLWEDSYSCYRRIQEEADRNADRAQGDSRSLRREEGSDSAHEADRRCDWAGTTKQLAGLQEDTSATAVGHERKTAVPTRRSGRGLEARDRWKTWVGKGKGVGTSSCLTKQCLAQWEVEALDHGIQAGN